MAEEPENTWENSEITRTALVGRLKEEPGLVLIGHPETQGHSFFRYNLGTDEDLALAFNYISAELQKRGQDETVERIAEILEIDLGWERIQQ